MEIPDDLRELARKHALANAIQHGGRADPKALMGKILGERPDLRPSAGKLAPILTEVAQEVNAMGPEAQKAALASAHPEFQARKRQEGRVGLPRLANDDVPLIVMRFAPNPNGPATIGHSRGMVLHAEYQRLYRSLGKPIKMLLRYDDTDPATKRPVLGAYESLLEDFRWLGGEPDLILYASDRIDVYYEHAAHLVELGHAYVCECSQEAFKALKDAGEACPHRATPAADNAAKWGRMLAGGYRPGEAVLRVATDIQHPDPALRDWVAFRILDESHPRVGDKYRVWPLLDFQSAIEDRLQGVTHILRGKDLIDSERKQTFVYRYFGWPYPETAHWGRIKIHEFGKVSKSLLAEGIKSGKFQGWDDVRLPTLAAMRRRGIRAEAIRSFWISLGLTEKDVAASMKNVEAENRKLVEPDANRYFFVSDPKPVTIEDLPADGLRGHAPLHPDHPERGRRAVLLAGRADTVLLDAQDHAALRKDGIVRLKDLGNVRYLGHDRATYVGDDLAVLKAGARIIQWVHAGPTSSVGVRVLMPDEEGTVVAGRAEAQCRQDLGHVVQFERFAFVRLEREENGTIVAPFTNE